MYAIIQTGGKQYKVQNGDIINVERLAGKAGDKITLSDILMTGGNGATTLGSPLVKGASATAEILDQIRGEKVKIFKKKRRHNYRRTKGHRQYFTVIRITELTGSDGKSEKAPALARPYKTMEQRHAAATAPKATKAVKAPAKPKAEKPAAEKKTAAKPAAKKAAPAKKAEGETKKPAAEKKPAAKKPAAKKEK